MSKNLESAQNALSITHPELAAEADGWDPATVSYGSNKKLKWRCAKEHSWEEIVANRSKGRGCPFCSRHRVLVGETDLLTTHPNIASEADGWDPSQVFAGSGKKYSWRCTKGHSWMASVNSRTSGNSGCPYCSRRFALSGENDLATTHPNLALEVDGWDATTLSAGSGKKMKWRCHINHRWMATVSSRALQGNGCPICNNSQIQVGFNDLATTNPELAAQAKGWDPKTVVSGTHQKRRWTCKSGHVWEASVTNRVRGRGCPICGNKKVRIGENDLATTHPNLALEADGWDPTTLTAGSNKRVNWRCMSYSHTWVTGVSQRTGQDQTNCPYCNNKKVAVGFNDLATTDSLLASEAVGWDPKTVSRGSDKKRRWRCSQGHEWISTIANRVNGKGCPSCAQSGFDPNADGYLYFLRHEDWGLLQIGITNFPEQRLAVHRKLGWETIEVRGRMDGALARAWESSILNMLKRHSVQFAPETLAGKFTGYTESWVENSLRVGSLKDLMDLVHQDE